MSGCICKCHYQIVIPGYSFLAGPAMIPAQGFGDTQKVRIWLLGCPLFQGPLESYGFEYRNPVGMLDIIAEL